MEIGIIGAGNVGTALAKLFIEAGHETGISASRGPEALSGLAMVLGGLAMTPTEAANFGEIVVLAIPFGAYKSLPKMALINKIVIDAMNYHPERDGNFPELTSGQLTSSELVEKYILGARMVKAFNTISVEHLETKADHSLPEEYRRTIFIAGDDIPAKRAVARLIKEIGFSAANTGGLHDGGLRQQPGTAIFDRDLTIGQAKTLLAQQ